MKRGICISVVGFCVFIILSSQLWAASITETSAAIGKDCVASGDYSTAMGKGSTASNYVSIAMGDNATADGYRSTAMGEGTRASGENSTAMGYITTASKFGCTAMGVGTDAREDYSTAMGHDTTASGCDSTAMGQGTTASGMNSTAMGYHTKAGGHSSFAGGNRMELTDMADHSFVWGYSNSMEVIDTSDAFLIFPAGTPGNVGIGTPTPNERLEIGGNGRAFFGNGGGSSRTGLLIDGNEPGPYARLEAYNYVTNTGMALVMNTVGGGNVGIGTTTPTHKLSVNGKAAKPGGGSWSVFSDARLKNVTGEYLRGLEAILELRPMIFRYKEDNPKDLPTDEEYIGFIAQEVQEVFPEAVSEGRDGYLDFNMHPVNVALVNAVKELKAENESIRAENDSLKAVNAWLKKDIKRIKAILGI